jgi:hypothetical protein
MPADGISLPPKRWDFGTSRWAGSKIGYINDGLGERGMTACGPEPLSSSIASAWQLSKVLRTR